MRFYWLFLLQICCGFVFAQTVFQKSYGDPGCYEEGFSIVELSSGGYLVSGAYGCTGIPVTWKSWLLHLNESGDTIWMKKDGIANGYIRKTTDGNFIFLGGTSAGLSYDTILITKCNSLGDTLWTRNLFFPQCGNLVYDLIPTSDNGFAITGIYSSNMDCNNLSFNSFLVKLNANGIVLWKNEFTGTGDEQFFNVRQMPDNGFALFGWTDSYGAGLSDFYLLRTDANGDSLWSKTYGGANDEYGYGMDITDDGGFILTGYSDSVIVIKTDANGTVEWQKKLAARCGSTYFKAIQTLDKNYAFLLNENTGSACSSSLIKTDRQGNILWKKNWGGLLREVYQPEIGSFLLAGYIASPAPSDLYVIKFDTTYEDTLTTVVPSNTYEVKIYPNPAFEKVTLEFSGVFPKGAELIDILGNKTYIPVRQSPITIERNNRPAGIYFLNIYWETGQILSRKILFQD